MYLPKNFIFLAFIGFILSGCEQVWSDKCQLAENYARSSEHDLAIEYASECLETDDLNNKSRLSAYRARAWSSYSLNQFERAVEDQQFVVRLAPTNYYDLINYSLYLRRLDRYEESLEFALLAEKNEQNANGSSMMTQYHLGWAYRDVGKYELAVDAFTKGIHYQPDYAHVYWQRGLAYDALHEKENAKADFELFASLASFEELTNEPSHNMSEYQEMLDRYGVIFEFKEKNQ